MGSTNDLSEKDISRFNMTISKLNLECFFNEFSKHLASPEDNRLLKLQKDSISNLKNNGRYDEQYVIINEGVKSDIDFTILFNENDPENYTVKIAGISEDLNPIMKEITHNCQIKKEQVKGDRT